METYIVKKKDFQEQTLVCNNKRKLLFGCGFEKVQNTMHDLGTQKENNDMKLFSVDGKTLVKISCDCIPGFILLVGTNFQEIEF